MNQEPENLLESDRIEDVLGGDTAEPSVVVVQNRNRVLPWVLVGVSIVAPVVGGALVYHRREVARWSTMAELAQRDLHRAIEQSRAEEAERRRSMETALHDLPDVTAASPRPSVPPEEKAILGSAGAGQPNALPASTPSSDPKAPDTPPAGKPKATSPSDEAPRPDPGSTAPAPTGAVAQVSQPAGPDRTSAARPDAPVSTELSPFEELDGEAKAKPVPVSEQADRVAATTPAPAATLPKDSPGAGPPAGADQPAELPAEQPLPSREESLRQFREEAARNKRENDQRFQQQQDELQNLQDDERRRFLDELRTILREFGRDGGPEVERLADRSGRTEDPKLLARARTVIAGNRTSQRTKVRQLRQLGVPETVILDYLANRLEMSLGTRGGPRSRNQVWVQAAYLLVKYDLEDGRPVSTPAATGRPVGAAGGAGSGSGGGAGGGRPSGGGPARPH